MAGMNAKPALPVGPLYTKDAQILGFAISNARVDELASASASVEFLMTDPTFTPAPVETWPLSRAADAHRALEHGRTGGRRIVLVPPRQED